MIVVSQNERMFDVIKQLKNKLKYSNPIPDIEKTFSSSNLPIVMIPTLLQYTKWISIPKSNRPKEYKWEKSGDVTMNDISWLYGKMYECKSILKEIQNCKDFIEDPEKNSMEDRTKKHVMRFFWLLLELKLNYSLPNKYKVEDLADDIGIFHQVIQTLKNKGWLVKKFDGKTQFVFDGIPTLNDALQLDSNEKSEMIGYSVREESIKKVFKLLKWVYENYKNSTYLPSDYEKKFGVANEFHRVIQKMNLLKKDENNVGYYKYLGEKPTEKLAREVYNFEKEGLQSSEVSRSINLISNFTKEIISLSKND